MRHSWKQQAVASLVAIVISGAYSYFVLHHSLGHERNAYISAKSALYEDHRDGRGETALLISALIGGALHVTFAVIPYELTLRAINSKRLSGED